MYKEEKKIEICDYEQFKQKIDNVLKGFSSKISIEFLKTQTTEKYSFNDIEKRINLFQLRLEQVEVNKGDRVAVILPHSPWSAVAGIALAYMNVTTVLIDAMLPAHEIRELIQYSDSQLVITTEGLYVEITAIQQLKVPCFVLDENGEIILCDDTNIPSKIVEHAKDAELDVIAILFSSGTTDQMKGVKVTYKSVILARDIFAKLSGLESYMTYLLVLPFNHIAGFSGVMTFFLTGCTLGFIEAVNASKLQDGLLRFQPYYFAMVPKVFEVMEQKIRAKVHEKGRLVESAINRMLSLSGFLRRNFGFNVGKFMFKSIRQQAFGGNIFGIGVGASPCKSSTAEFFLNLGLEWANLYATTETGVPITATGVLDKYPVGTVGNVNHHNQVKVRIANPDEKGIGEIQVHTEMIMKGYFRQPELTEKAFDGVWFKTGDYGYIDRKGYLYITGRIKESIILKNGKKVAPIDVDEYYKAKLPQYEMACCGMNAEEGSYDEIHMFVVEQGSEKENDIAISEIMKYSYAAEVMYQIAEIHIIEKIPMTTVGKIRRFKLKDFVKGQNVDNGNTKIRGDSIEERVKGVIAEIIKCDISKIINEQNLKDDLGIDSLAMFEICAKLEKEFNILLAEEFSNIRNVGELIAVIKGNQDNHIVKRYDIREYPLHRKKKDVRFLRMFMWFCRNIWNFEITGFENIPEEGNFILAPNHESHLDGLWVWTALHEGIRKKKVKNSIVWSKICCMAKQEHLEHRFSKWFMKLLGGIPVDRNGNSIPALERCKECIDEGACFLIHPEGTRTRNGNMGRIKAGVAKLAITTEKKIVPVVITGAREIYGPDSFLPHFYDFKKKEKYKLYINFLEPLYPKYMTEEQIVEKLEKNLGGGEDNFKYPQNRRKSDYRKLKMFEKISRNLYNLQIQGIDNIPKNSNYIVCMNHESMFDGLWMLSAVGMNKINIDKLAYMAAVHTNKGFINKIFFRMIGGIPVDRFGNTMPAYMCAKEWINQGNNIIIHPEGARSRDGSMLPFKNGAAKLAIDTNTCIVPVRIHGAFAVFPRTRKFPRLFKTAGEKLSIDFTIGKPLNPKGYDVQQLTQCIRDIIEKMEE